MSYKYCVYSSFGCIIEWFDFALYGFFGTIFSKIFFSEAASIHWLSLIITYAIFTVGYLARPIGGLILGYLGDRYGRLVPLKLTPLLLTATTLAIACIPTYSAIGSTAVVSLVSLRIIQGMLLGGEFTGNLIYLCESSRQWRYLRGSFGSCTGSTGIILACGAVALISSWLTPSQMQAYGWRITFLLAAPLGLIAYYARKKLPTHSPALRSTQTVNPITETLRYKKKLLLQCLGLICLHAVSFYFVFVFLPLYLTQIRQQTDCAALLTNTGFLLLHLILIPCFGLIANSKNGLNLLIVTALTFLSLSIPLFQLIAYGSESSLLLSLCVFSVMTAANAAILPGLLTDRIPANVRCTVLSLTFNIGFGLFGSTVPAVGLFIINKATHAMYPAYYLILAAIITAGTGLLLKRKSSHYGQRRIYHFESILSKSKF